jgi:hypothetical protein
MTAEQVSAADLRSRWDQAVPLRWLLVDEFTMMNEPDTAVAVCADIGGLFVGEPTVPGIGCLAASGPPGPAAGPARLIGSSVTSGPARHWPIISQARPTSQPGPPTTWTGST